MGRIADDRSELNSGEAKERLGFTWVNSDIADVEVIDKNIPAVLGILVELNDSDKDKDFKSIE